MSTNPHAEAVTAIVLAAGAGTRMKSTRAKVLHQIAGRSMLEHALVAVTGAGVHTTVAVVGHDREQVSEAIAAFDPAIVQAVQEQQNGTGHAVHVALESLDSPPEGTVIVTYADVPLLSAQTLAELLVATGAAGHAVTILTAEVDDPTGYGRILRDADGGVTAIREHKDASDDELAVREINSGILVVDAEFLTAAVASLETDNAQGELYLTDIVGKAVAEGRPVGAHVLEDVWQTEGVNDRAQLARLGAELNRRITAHWMAEGVTIVDPATTWIDSAVTIEPDVTILPGTQLLGATAVAARRHDRPRHHAAQRRGRRRRHRRPYARLRRRDRRRRDGRPVRLPAPRHRARRRRQDRHVRRGQELDDRRGRQGAAPVATSATPTSARAPTSAPARSSPTTTASTSTARRSAGTPRPAPTTRSSPRSRSATARSREPARRSARTCRRGRWPSAQGRAEEH